MPVVSLKGNHGEGILVEVEEGRRVTRGGRGDLLADKAREYVGDFGRVGEYIMNVCGEVYEKYQGVAASIRPERIEIEFGIKISGETGIPFVSKGAAEATIKVTAKWGGGAE